MKITKKDFEEMRGKYREEIKIGNPGENQQGAIHNQTNWVFFDRETIERVLAKADADPKVGGIKFYMVEYTEKTASDVSYIEDPDQLVGRLTLVMSPADKKVSGVEDIQTNEEGDYENFGKTCPPACDEID